MMTPALRCVEDGLATSAPRHVDEDRHLAAKVVDAGAAHGLASATERLEPTLCAQSIFAAVRLVIRVGRFAVIHALMPPRYQ